MSTLLDTTRSKLATLVAAFQTANYSTMEVNYPGRMVTDVEQATSPFVTVEYDMRQRARSLPIRDCVTVEGQLVINHFARSGSGSKIFDDYSDKLFTYLGLKTLDSITFYEVQPYNNSGIPGFDGRMNSVNFEIDYFSVT